MTFVWQKQGKKEWVLVENLGAINAYDGTMYDRWQTYGRVWYMKRNKRRQTPAGWVAIMGWGKGHTHPGFLGKFGTKEEAQAVLLAETRFSTRSK